MRAVTFKTLKLRRWDDIHAISRRRHWLFRGQGHVQWNLETALERTFRRESIPAGRRIDVEAELLRDFQRAFHQYGTHLPEPNAHLEWLSLMQHHGAPTRLLDFSYSIYVAAYFALETADSDCAVLAINGPWAVRQSVAALKMKDEHGLHRLIGRTSREQEGEAYKAYFREPFVPSAYPLNPFRLNDRLRIQKGLFVIPGDIRISFMDNLAALPGYKSPANVIKIVIPRAMRREALEQLFSMNVSRTSLFPGLDGYASSLGIYHPVFNGADWATK